MLTLIIVYVVSVLSGVVLCILVDDAQSIVSELRYRAELDRTKEFVLPPEGE